ncbi:MAG: hypothetical protein ACRCT8_06525, partial [Lacipirellulaceae bacterium]
LQRMHAEEQGVLRDTKRATEAERGARAALIAAATLADRQSAVARDARRAASVVREDGRSIVFVDALDQVAGEAAVVERRLRDGRLGRLTERLEEGLVEALAEMLAAVEQELDDLRQQQAQAGGAGSPGGGETSLVSQLAELRMLRGVQARLGRQTGAWADAVAEGETSADEARSRLAEIAAAQSRLAEAARNAAANAP